MIRPDIKKSRYAVCVFFLILGTIFGSWASRIPIIKEELGLNDAELGSALFAIPFGQMFSMALSAWIINKFGSKTALRYVSLIAPAFVVFAGLSHNLVSLIIPLFFFGMCDNLFNISVNTQGVNIEHSYNRTIMATFHGLFSLGGFLGGLIGLMCNIYQISVIAHFCTIFIICSCISAISGKYLTDQDYKKTSNHVDVAESNHKSVVLDRYVLLLGFMSFFAMICEGVMYDWSGVYFNDVVRVNSSYVQLGYVLCMGTMTFGRFISDHFVDKWGSILVIRVSGILILLGLFISSLYPSILTASICFAIIGLGIASTVPICNSLAGKGSKYNPSTALAIVTSIGFVGFLLGPPLIGYLASWISLRWTFTVMSGMGLCIIIFTYLINLNSYRIKTAKTCI